jgi:hypothetical protein
MHRPSDQGRSFHYRLFGLHVRSELELPELRPADPANPPDVRISLSDGGANTGTVLAVDDVAQFHVSGGSHIQVVPQPGVPDRDVRLFLLGSAMGMLLHQRGLLPLHANAVEIDGKAVAFMGPSGAGKSTLAVWFHDRGYRIIADDVCVIRFDDDGQPWAEPGLPRLRLWKDALEGSGRDHSRLERSRAAAGNLEKYDLPIGLEPIAEPIPVGAAYLLTAGDRLAISPLAGVEAADAIFANTYRGRFVTPEMMKPYWSSTLQFVRRTALFQARRQWGRDRFGEQAEALLRHAKDTLSAPAR